MSGEQIVLRVINAKKYDALLEELDALRSEAAVVTAVYADTAPTGWICPRCNAVNSPLVRQCCQYPRPQVEP